MRLFFNCFSRRLQDITNFWKMILKPCEMVHLWTLQFLWEKVLFQEMVWLTRNISVVAKISRSFNIWFFLSGLLWIESLQRSTTNYRRLKKRMKLEIRHITPVMIHNFQEECYCRFNYCQEAGGNTNEKSQQQYYIAKLLKLLYIYLKKMF